MVKKKYHILPLDGGDSWAFIQVKVLIDLFGPMQAAMMF